MPWTMMHDGYSILFLLMKWVMGSIDLLIALNGKKRYFIEVETGLTSKERILSFETETHKMNRHRIHAYTLKLYRLLWGSTKVIHLHTLKRQQTKSKYISTLL